ncbi:MAG: cyclic nucleotide-binding domain-containing protein [Verrucomicrobiales bacterium]|nr:cyclic nucleotide-binding domain-containing protein [Verrucomicrobiales bacterium]
MSTNIEIVSSHIDHEELTRFRYDIYVRGMKKNVAGADHDLGRISDELDAISKNFVIRKDNRILGTLRLTYSDELSSVPAKFAEFQEIFSFKPFLESACGRLCFTSRLMISPELRGSTLLWRLFSEAFRTAMSDGVLFDFCAAPPYMAQLYAQLGYRRYKSNILYQSFGYDIPMVQVLRDAQHLEKCGSPFLKALHQLMPDENCQEVEWFLENYTDALQTYDLQSLDHSHALEETARLALECTGETIFAGLSRKEVEELRLNTYPLKFESGDHIIQKEDQREEMFIVEQGSVSVRQENISGDPIILGRGQIFGEVGLLTATGRTADVIALEDGLILVLTRQTAMRLIKTKPGLMATVLLNIGRILASRLTGTYEILKQEKTNG